MCSTNSDDLDQLEQRATAGTKRLSRNRLVARAIHKKRAASYKAAFELRLSVDGVGSAHHQHNSQRGRRSGRPGRAGESGASSTSWTTATTACNPLIGSGATALRL